MNRLSRRVADLHHARQRRLLGIIDQSAAGMVRIVGTAWQGLLAVLREPQGYALDRGRALTVLRQLRGQTVGGLADRLTLVYRQAHATAANSVLAAAGKPLVEAIGDPDWLRFMRHEKAHRSEVMLWVDVDKLDALWRLDVSYYLPAEALGFSEIPGRREEFERFLGRGQRVQAPRIVYDPGSKEPLSFIDGRHRFAVLRDLGVDRVPVMVDREQAAALAAVAAPVEEPQPFESGEDALQALLVGPPSQELVWRALAPLIRPADWEAVGDGANRKLPQELAQMVAGGMLRGETQRDIAKAIRPYLDGSRVRAARVARTFGLHVAHVAQMDAWGQLGDVVVGYQIHATKSPCPPSRKWHQSRDGTIYYKQPGPGQKGLAQMPRPPMEAPDVSERPIGAPQIAWNCKCYLTPVLDVARLQTGAMVTR